MLKKLKFSWKVWFLIIALVLSLIAINPSPFKSGVLVKSVDTNSSESMVGITSGEIISSFNGEEIRTLEDYANAVAKLPEGENKISIVTNKQEYIYLSSEKPSLTLSNVPKSNLIAGLDLVGGSRALVKPEEDIDDEAFETLISSMQNRFNVYGLSDVRIRKVSDLEGQKFVLVEIAGATVSDLENLISQQGKFEAKIGEEVVFIGGERDITSVCRFDPNCAGIIDCGSFNGQDTCTFQFTIFLSEEAAKRHADVTNELSTNASNSQYLDQQLDLFVDDRLVDSLLISESLKGVVTTRISVSGSGTGLTRDAAVEAAQLNMNGLQTLLITGSLPFKLSIEKLDSISSLVGDKLSKNILITMIAAFLAVSLFIYFRYRSFKIVFPIILTIISEVLIILGIASVIRWNLDLASIAGIIVVIGTGLDHQIIIIDEARLGKIYGWKERMKRAFFIIMGAYSTTIVAMLPLAWAGTGLLKGFAITTIIGITVGVMITRPAFADMVKNLIKD